MVWYTCRVPKREKDLKNTWNIGWNFPIFNENYKPTEPRLTTDYEWNKHFLKITPEIIIMKYMKNSKIENNTLKATRERQYMCKGRKIRMNNSRLFIRDLTMNDSFKCWSKEKVLLELILYPEKNLSKVKIHFFSKSLQKICMLKEGL